MELRLLVPARAGHGQELPSLVIGGRRWCLTELPFEDAPEYTCVSYAWGASRVPHPLHESETMSTRTMVALALAAGVEPPGALWVDSFCVPAEEPGRSACLRSMGAIYGRASHVVVVLSPASSTMLAQIAETDRVDADALLAFERDEWVARAWTYQEVVNSNKVDFVAEGGRAVVVGAEDVLRNVAYAIDSYKKERGWDSFEMRSHHPRLDGLEDLIVDWKIAGYQERSAYQVMSCMYGRTSERPEDYFPAMVGAIGAVAPAGGASPETDPAEHFMQVCEAKGDYSFLYCSAPREETPGRRWRPVAAGRHEAVFPWHSYGDGQTGLRYPTHVELDGMWMLEPGTVGLAADGLAQRWVGAAGAVASSEKLPEVILHRLRLAGFSGCGAFVETEEGFFFSQSPLPPQSTLVAAVATGVQTALGAPGLLLTRGRGPEAYDCHGVGFFVGRVPKAGQRICVM